MNQFSNRVSLSFMVDENLLYSEFYDIIIDTCNWRTRLDIEDCIVDYRKGITWPVDDCLREYCGQEQRWNRGQEQR